MPHPEPTIAGTRSVRFPVYEFLALFLPIAVLVLVIGFSFASLRTGARIEELLDHDSTRLNRISGFIGAEVAGSLNHLRSLATEDVTRQALNSRDPRYLKSLEFSFLLLARRNPHYQQIRWLDETGHERVRVMRDGIEEPYTVPANELQDKSQRYYFEAANALLPGELYISRIDLNVEHGQIEMPPRPMLRIATPVEDGNRRRRGILIINIAMNYLFDIARNPEQIGAEAYYWLLNQEGYLLNGEIEDLSGDAPTKHVNFGASHPKIWKSVSMRESGSFESWEGLWTWKTLSPVETFNRLIRVSPDHALTFDKVIDDDFSLTLVAHRPVTALMDLRREVRVLISLGVVLGLAVYGFALFLYLSGHVRARRAELSAAYAMARAENLARMKELEERFHRLVEASSIGQLVVDSDGRIEISNPAAERMLGYETGELQGLRVEMLLPSSLQKKHLRQREAFMQAPEARKMGEGRELAAVTKSGATIPVEVGLNPYADQGRQLVLVSIIDLSDRRDTGEPTAGATPS